MKKADRVIRITVSVFLGILAFAVALSLYSLIRLEYSSSRLEDERCFSVMDVIIYGSSSESVSGSFKVLDSESHTIAELERSWQSDRVCIDFISIKLKKGYVYLPYRIYGNRPGSVKSGINLKRYYFSGCRCLLYGNNIDPEEKKLLSFVSRSAFNSRVRLLSSRIDFVTLDLSSCKSGIEYLIQGSPDGKINLLPIDE